ncbi:MAG: NAD(P)-dependent alcohol dehydrogenase [Anaerolineales bacterium]|nr:NAD(P)-dependent alcohol dehydrogenase [Anaerolineales bacterium]
MKAITISDYGAPDVIKLKEVDKPVIKDNDVLIRVCASSINAADLFSMHGSPWLVRLSLGFPKPKDYILGWDIAGRVEAIGQNVTRFRPGDEVYTASKGAFAEYVAVKEGALALKPVNLTFEEAAAIPNAALAALHCLRDAGKVQPGQQVLINGASGGVGTFAVQIAKTLGAEVTGVCSTRNVEMVTALGADHVIDYTRQDFTKAGQRYDPILDNVGNRSFSEMRQALTPQGKISPNRGYGGMSYVLKAYLLGPFMRQQGAMVESKANAADLDVLKQLSEAGKLTPIIDRTYALADIADAFRYFEAEHARGKVAIMVAGE